MSAVKYEWKASPSRPLMVDLKAGSIDSTQGASFRYRRVGARRWTKFFLKDQTADWARENGAKLAAAHEKVVSKAARTEPRR